MNRRHFLSWTLALGAAPLLGCVGGSGGKSDASVAAGTGMTFTQDMVYAEPAPGETLCLDVYRPVPGGRPAPVVLLFHGGGWSAGDKADMAHPGFGRLAHVARQR